MSGCNCSFPSRCCAECRNGGAITHVSYEQPTQKDDTVDVPTKVIHVHITVNALDYCKKVESEVWKAIRRAGCM
jgi:hypothetical protein